MNAPFHHSQPALPQRFPLMATHFIQLADSGAFDAVDEAVELLEGTVVMAPAPGPGHADCERHTVRAMLRRLIAARLDTELEVQTGGRLVLGANTVVGPDIMVVRPKAERRDWLPADVVLLVEVAQSSLPVDLGTKAGLYAAAGIADYWVLDVEAQAVVQHRDPRGDRYGTVLTVDGPGLVTALLEPVLSFEVTELF